MPVERDDLQRLRDAIDKGWDFTHFHSDFGDVLSTLVNDAIDVDESCVIDTILDNYPDESMLDDAIESLNQLLDDDEADLPKGVKNIIDQLKDLQTSLEERYTEAYNLANPTTRR